MTTEFVLTPDEETAARRIAEDKSRWGGVAHLVCWDAVKLHFGRGRGVNALETFFRIDRSSIARRARQENWGPMSVGEVAQEARVAWRAMTLRRRLLREDPDAADDARAVDLEASARARRAAAAGALAFRSGPLEQIAPSAPSLTPAVSALRDDPPSPPLAEPDLPDWADIAHAAQLAPVKPWRTWLMMGGRGAGKTRAGAEWVRELVESGLGRRIALVGPTLHDVREVMIDGPSGLIAISPAQARPKYEATRRRLVWSGEGPWAGAMAFAFSAEDPDSLRGPQFDAAWCDEIGAWAKDEATWKTLAFAMRLGPAPRIVATTTPRPRALVKLLVERAERKQGGVAITRASTRANAENLAPDFVAALEEDYAGTALARQEIDGELIEDAVGALWSRAMIEAARADAAEAERLDRVVVAVDPPAGASGRSDACGIIVAGIREGVVYVLHDASVRGLKPSDWAERVIGVALGFGVRTVVAESNQGGEMVRAVLDNAGARARGLRVKLVHAVVSKRERAEPVSTLYARGRVKHTRVLKELEDEMCAFGAPAGDGRRSRSPDRVDALVWAVDELTRKRPRPQVDAL